MEINKEELRKQRGLEIAKTCEIRRGEEGWIVPSQSGAGHYQVSLNGFTPICTCPDFELRKCKCKHIFAVEFRLTKEIDNEGNMKIIKTMKMTYSQDWKSYNNAQCNEQIYFMELLDDLVKNVEQPLYEFGRPQLPFKDMIFASALKVYSKFSLRRFMSYLKIAKEKGFINKEFSYVSISNFMNKPELQEILRNLIRLSSLPLKAVDTKIGVDSSGFSTSRFDRWFSQVYGKQIKYRHWIKCHLSVGTKTNIVTDVIVTRQFRHDSLYLKELVKNTAENFKVEEVLADKGYSSRENLNFVEEIGATPFISFKKNIKSDTRSINSPMWRKMFHFFMYKHEEFLQHYHLRSNVETAFHMIKTKFSDSVNSKLQQAQLNEVLLKILCHNICVLIQEMFELGIDTKFNQANDLNNDKD
jgi:transposase